MLTFSHSLMWQRMTFRLRRSESICGFTIEKHEISWQADSVLFRHETTGEMLSKYKKWKGIAANLLEIREGTVLEAVRKPSTLYTPPPRTVRDGSWHGGSESSVPSNYIPFFLMILLRIE